MPNYSRRTSVQIRAAHDLDSSDEFHLCRLGSTKVYELDTLEPKAMGAFDSGNFILMMINPRYNQNLAVSGGHTFLANQLMAETPITGTRQL